MLTKTLSRLLSSIAAVALLGAYSTTGHAAASQQTEKTSISYQHIRNATAKIKYGGKTFLIDPYLAPKGTYAGFEGTINSEKRNPLIDMTQSTEDVIKGVDAVIVTHTHDDHWDKAAQQLLPKDLPVFAQNAGDARIIREQGFKDVRVLGKNTLFGNVRLSKTGGQHGSDAVYAIPKMAEIAGEAMGVVMQADGVKTLYIVGDTIWNYEVEAALKQYRPDVLVLNTGYAQVLGFEGNQGRIIMGLDDVGRAYQAMPQAQIVTVHMDAVNHTTVSSNDMRRYVKKHGYGKRVHVPKEGEVMKF